MSEPPGYCIDAMREEIVCYNACVVVDSVLQQSKNIESEKIQRTKSVIYSVFDSHKSMSVKQSANP